MSGLRKVMLKSPKPRIGFGYDRGSRWYRYMKVDGERVFLLGNVCPTCHFFFERYKTRNSGSLLTADEISNRLEKGIDLLDDDLVHSLGRILPSGDYVVWNGPVHPCLVVPGGDGDYFQHEVRELWEDCRYEPVHDPKTPYYRGHSKAIDHEKLLLEFLIPLQDLGSLDQSRVAHYEKLIADGEMPTAFAVSVVDIAYPADHEEEHKFTIHWTIAHYLLDGHHKIAAAERTGTACGLLSFASVKASVVVKPETVVDAIWYLS